MSMGVTSYNLLKGFPKSGQFIINPEYELSKTILGRIPLLNYLLG